MAVSLIIDGMNMAFRAKYAYNLSHNGADTSVLYGVVRMLMSLIKKYKPVSVVFCWDGGTPQYRKRLVPSYKENRKHDDPDWDMFLDQLRELQDVFRYSGMLQVGRTGIEADDLIYHITRMLIGDSEIGNSIIVSTDDDLLQCVKPGVSVWNPTKKMLVTDATFYRLKGYKAFQHVCAKVLIGDSSDGIPGVHGIGPKTAVKLLSDGRGIVEACTPKMKARLIKFVEDGKYNAAYSTIDLSFDLAGSRQAIIDAVWIPYSKRLYMWCIKHGFTSIIEAGSLGALFGSLREPEFRVDRIRFPVVWDYRRTCSG